MSFLETCWWLFWKWTDIQDGQHNCQNMGHSQSTFSAFIQCNYIYISAVLLWAKHDAFLTKKSRLDSWYVYTIHVIYKNDERKTYHYSQNSSFFSFLSSSLWVWNEKFSLKYKLLDFIFDKNQQFGSRRVSVTEAGT